MRLPRSRAAFTLALTLAASAIFQHAFAQSRPGSAAGSSAPGHDAAAESARRDLEASLRELAELRERIARERVPLNKRLAELESRLSALRAEAGEAGRLIDSRNLDMSNLTTEIKARRDERVYLSNLLDEYVRNLESRVHIAELQRHRDVFEAARLAPEDASLKPAQVYEAQTAAVETSLGRIEESLGGAVFSGTAVDEGGRVSEVQFALFGPVALYRTLDGSRAGLAEQKLGSLEPNMVPVEDEELQAGISAIVADGEGLLPFDPSLGSAQRIEETRETFVEHIKAGGPVMVPIIGMALAALLVALLKWIQIVRVPIPSTRILGSILDALKHRNYETASARVSAIRGPTGEMLRAGVEHLGEPKALVEEVMFEKMLETRLRLQSFLPFVALSASAAPLLGLLGTVTGMINTFKLITVFGTGDARTLSSGISEALITTEYGLIVAIPSLLIYAYLSRRAQRLVDGMEKTAISFLNRLSAGASTDGGPQEGREAAA